MKPAITPLRKEESRKHMAMNPLEIIFKEGKHEDAMKIERKNLRIISFNKHFGCPDMSGVLNSVLGDQYD